MKTKEKILLTSVELFNRSGATSVTTNHISDALKISPGNLYFHYRNKEQIIFELFKRMCQETYEIWKPRKRNQLSPLEFVEANFEIYWRYRFFHREMYTLRRKDKNLSLYWKKHIQKMMKLMNILYKQWVRAGLMIELKNTSDLVYVYESLLALSTTFLQFFESTEKTPTRKSLERGKTHVARLLFPYVVGQMRDDFEKFIYRAN